MPNADARAENEAERGITTLIITLVCGCVIFGVASVLFAIVFPVLAIPTFTLLGALCIATIAYSVKLLFAKRNVLQSEEQEHDLFMGLAKLVAWDPTDGVLFLKNKSVSYVDDNLYDGGGIRLIYPAFGEELALRVPLEMLTLDFRDEKVITREYLALEIKGTIKWQIVDLHSFYLLVSRDIHFVSDRHTHATLPIKAELVGTPSSPRHARNSFRKRESAEQWLRYMVEEQTRTIVSRLSTGLLVAEQVAADLPDRVQDKVKGRVFNPVPMIPSASTDYRSTTDGLASAIQQSMGSRVKQYGIDVNEVTLQEIRLPHEIHDAVVDASVAGYLPHVAQKKAAARRQRLETDVDVIGQEATAAREVVGSAQPGAFFSDFLTEVLASSFAKTRNEHSRTQ